jgi:hypothetical protein
MAAVQGRVVEVRPDTDCRYMDPSEPFPYHRPSRVCFVIAATEAGGRALEWLTHRPAPR